MFGHQDDQQQDTTQIPDQSIDGVLNDQAAPASPWQHPGLPVGDSPVSTPVPPTVTEAPAPIFTAPVPVAADDSATADLPTDLIDIKQQALSQLTPLVGHLEQSPEERFRTTMMMIQASDNQSLVKDAYAAAQAIPDEKSRAQALLDIVNEINYFTQQPAE